MSSDEEDNALLLIITIGVLIGIVVAISGCRVVSITKPDGTQIISGSILTQPEIAEATFSDKSMSLRGYASRDSEIVGAAVRAGIEAAK